MNTNQHSLLYNLNLLIDNKSNYTIISSLKYLFIEIQKNVDKSEIKYQICMLYRFQII